MTRTLDPDELASLQEQRDFLLASLDDLEREHEAGDVDAHDYAELRDDYTARAARVIRALESHEPRPAAERPARPRWQPLAVAAGLVAFVLVAVLLVNRGSGERQAGETATGDIRESSEDTVRQAFALGQAGRYDEAIVLFDEVLDEDPDHAQALTYKGWFQWLDGDRAGLTTLLSVVEVDDEYPDAYAFLAIVLNQVGQVDAARQTLDRLEELDPPPEILVLVEELRQELDAAAPPPP